MVFAMHTSDEEKMLEITAVATEGIAYAVVEMQPICLNLRETAI